MILGVDIGGTKTLLAQLDDSGQIVKTEKFPTDQDYNQFKAAFADHLKTLGEADYQAGGVAIPGVVDYAHNRGVAFGNLPWHNVPIEDDIEKLINAPVYVENDAKAGGLSEAMLIKNEFKRVLYITLGTGIGVSLIIDGIIDRGFGSGGGRAIVIEHAGKVQSWEDFASGKAIVERFGKRAEEITDIETWKTIARDIAIGLINLVAIIQPEVIVVGGGVGQYYDRFAGALNAELKKYETPLNIIPPVRKAQRPEEAVIFGCYDLVKQQLAKVHNIQPAGV